MTHEKLWRAYWKTRSDDARNDLLEAHLPWLRDRTKKYLAARGLSHYFDDVLEEVCLRVLATAIPRFEPGRSAFTSYLNIHIHHAAEDHFRRQDHLSRNDRSEVRKFQTARADLQATLGHRPNDYELAQALDIPEDRIVEATDPPSLLGFWDPPAPPDAPVMEPEEFDRLFRGIPRRSRYIMERYYRDGWSLAAVAKDMGCSQTRVCQLIGEAKVILAKAAHLRRKK